MKTDMVETGDLSSQLTIVIETNDYKEKFESELKKQRNKAHLKGFRKGKTPMSAVRKMFGKSILSEVINDKLQNAIGDYITENELDILGNPLPSDDRQQVDFDPKNLIDFEFKFDLGLAPQIDVTGANAEDSYDTYKVAFGEAQIDEEIETLLKRNGKQEEVSGPIEEMDILGAEISSKAEDVEFSTEISVMPERLTDEYKVALIGQEVGFSLDIDISELEKNSTEEYVNKYFLKDAPENVGKEFTLTVSTIKRLVPATLDEEFIKTVFNNEEVTDEEGVRSFLKNELETYYERQAKAITKRKILEHLLNENEYQLPDEFLKRWLKATNEELTDEQVEKEYPDFVKNLKWTLIKQKLAKDYEIQISPEKIKSSLTEKFKAQFAQYGYGAMGGLDFENIGDRLMQNQESVQKEYEELLAETVLDSVTDKVALVEKEVSIDEYKEILDELQKNNEEQ